MTLGLWELREVRRRRTRLARAIGAHELRARLAHEIGVATQMTAHVNRRTELGETIRFERFDDLRIEVQLLGGCRDGQTGALTTRAQPLADRPHLGCGRRRRCGCDRVFHRAQGLRCSASACAESGKSRRNAREYFSSSIRSFDARATPTAANSTSGLGRNAFM